MWGEKAKLHATVQFIPKKTPTEKTNTNRVSERKQVL